MTRIRPAAAALAALTTWALATAPAHADVGPPLAPAPAAPAASPLELAIDALIPTAASYVALRYAVAGLGQNAPDQGVAATAPANGILTGSLMLAGLAAPPAALVAYRERPFAFDVLLATFAGGLVGLGAGFGVARVAGGGAPSPDLLAFSMAVGQGLATAGTYHLYRAHKATATDLDKLPANRKDDPIDDWKFWRERRNP